MTDAQDTPSEMWKKLQQFFIEREVREFYIYLNTLEQDLDTKAQKLSKNLAAKDKLFNEKGQNSEWRKEWIDLKGEVEQVDSFINLLRQSFLTSLYSFMELQLVRQCYVHSKHKDEGQSYRSIRATGINKAKVYFSTVIQSDYSFGSSEDWLWIKNFQLLRDCIIHRQGSLTGFSNFEVNTTLAQFVERENGLGLFGINDNQIFIEHIFCLKALQIVHRFVLELLVKN